MVKFSVDIPFSEAILSFQTQSGKTDDNLYEKITSIIPEEKIYAVECYLNKSSDEPLAIVKYYENNEDKTLVILWQKDHWEIQQ